MTFKQAYDKYLPLIPQLAKLEECEQDSVWHAEGNVLIHTEMVYNVALLEPSPEKELLLLAALLHDIGKPFVTRRKEIKGVEKVIAPGHERLGRSFVLKQLIDTMPWSDLIRLANLVGYHQEPKMLVIKDEHLDKYQLHNWRIHGAYELMYHLERADMIGRTGPDKEEQLEYLEFYKSYCKDLPRASYFNFDGADHPDFWNFRFRKACEDLSKHTGISNTPSYLNYVQPRSLVNIMCGPSGSGKSTLREQLLSKINSEVISLDEIRKEITGDASDQSENEKVINIAHQRYRKLLGERKNIIWDATCLRKDYRDPLISLANKYDAQVNLLCFLKTKETCLANNKKRTRQVPDSVIDKQFASFEVPEDKEATLFFITKEGVACSPGSIRPNYI